MSAHRGRLIIAALTLAAVAAILIIGTLARAGTQATQTSPAATSSLAPYLRKPASSGVPAASAESQAESAATSFILAYASQSWRDPEATTWVSRAALHATSDFARQLVELHEGSSGIDWNTFVTSRSIRTAKIDYANAQLSDQRSGFVAVRYQVTTMADGTEPVTVPLSKLISVRLVDGEWRVSSTNDLAAGYAPATEEAPTVPAQAPTIPE